MITREQVWTALIPEYNASKSNKNLGFDIFDFRDWAYQSYGLYPATNTGLWEFQNPEDETLFLLKFS